MFFRIDAVFEDRCTSVNTPGDNPGNCVCTFCRTFSGQFPERAFIVCREAAGSIQQIRSGVPVLPVENRDVGEQQKQKQGSARMTVAATANNNAPVFSTGGLAVSLFSDMTSASKQASKPLFIIKACFYSAGIFPVSFLRQIFHNCCFIVFLCRKITCRFFAAFHINAIK